jgi:methyltransferase (TIGR00027 family)
MKGSKAGRTAYAIAAVRCLEEYYPEEKRLFTDPYALHFVQASKRPFMPLLKIAGLRDWILRQQDKQFPGFMGGILCRTAYIDDALVRVIGSGIKTVVNLGAGFDSRALRLPQARQTRFYEVDEAAIQEAKKKKLIEIDGRLPDHVTYAPIDFNTQSLDEELTAAGFSKTEPAVFIWEGVTQYISSEAVDNTLRFIGTAAPGSRVLFTYVIRSYIDNPAAFTGLGPITRAIKRQGVEWVSGFSPKRLAERLAGFNLKLIEDVGKPEYLEWFMRPSGRNLTVWEIERAALAEVL